MIEITPQLNDLLSKVFSKKKYDHSLRVLDLVGKLCQSEATEYSALMHDFIERGGDPKELSNPFVLNVVKALTKDKNSDVLDDAKDSFGNLTPAEKQAAILIRICDRIDHLRTDPISGEYLVKSKELLKWLFKNYCGDRVILYKVREILLELGIKIKKKHILVSEKCG